MGYALVNGKYAFVNGKMALERTYYPIGYIPVMSNNTTPSPFVASSSGNLNGGAAWNAFDGNNSSAVWSYVFSTAFFSKIAFTDPISIWKLSYRVRIYNAGPFSGANMEFKDQHGATLYGPVFLSGTDAPTYDAEVILSPGTPSNFFELDFTYFTSGMSVQLYRFQIYPVL